MYYDHIHIHTYLLQYLDEVLILNGTITRQPKVGIYIYLSYKLAHRKIESSKGHTDRITYANPFDSSPVFVDFLCCSS